MYTISVCMICDVMYVWNKGKLFFFLNIICEYVLLKYNDTLFCVKWMPYLINTNIIETGVQLVLMYYVVIK